MIYHTILPTNPQGSEVKDFLHNRCTQNHLVQQRHSSMPIIWAYAALYICSDAAPLFSLSTPNFIQEVISISEMSCPQLLYTGLTQKNICHAHATLRLAHRKLCTSQLKQKRQKHGFFWFTDQTVKQAYKRNKS